MKFSISGTGTKHRALINENDVSSGVSGVIIEVEAGRLAQVTLTMSATEEVIEEDADIFITMGNKKYRILEEK